MTPAWYEPVCNTCALCKVILLVNVAHILGFLSKILSPKVKRMMYFSSCKGSNVPFMRRHQFVDEERMSATKSGSASIRTKILHLLSLSMYDGTETVQITPSSRTLASSP